MAEKVAIIINTCNRPDEVKEVISHLLFHNRAELNWLYDTRIFVVDDASETPCSVADFRFEKRAGIPKAKNKGLRLAYDWGAEHFFLFDDDVYPIDDEWWKPYIESGQNHLAYTFTSGWDGTSGWAKGYIDNKNNVVVNQLSCGCMMYVRRKVLDVVGGFDEKFGLVGKYCDTEWQRRIHAAGLTPHPFQDAIGSERLFHSMDEHHEVSRSFSEEERKKGIDGNKVYYERVKDKNRYCDF